MTIPGEVVKRGVFLYAGAVECDLCIARSSVHYGTGDAEDPPEVAEDLKRETYYVYYGSTTERGRFSAGGGAYPSLPEAVAAVEHAPGVGGVRWSE